ncbi:MAG: AEC family transporter [Lachnospiraceae bacterium]|nr:AEC family transporter [Lachnospiraceae bacterium]
MALSDILVFAVNSVLPVILLVALGYILKEKGFFSREFLKVANKTVFRVLLPVLLFTNLAELDSFSQLRWDAVLYVLAAIAILFGIGLLFARAVPDRYQKGVLLQCVFRSNFALVGVPLAQLMAGEKGVQAVAILSAFTIPVFNVLSVISLSVYIQSESGAGGRIAKTMRGILHNPLIIGVLAGIVCVLLKPLVHCLPTGMTLFLGKFTFVGTVLDYLAKASTPVALLVLGGQFEMSSIKDLKRQITLGVIGRLLFAPLIGIGGAALLQGLGFFRFDNGTYAALIALFGTPVAVASAIMAEEMGNDGQLAGQLVVWTTLLSAGVIFGSVLLMRALGFV